MNMNAFEQGSGFSVNWIHLFCVAVSGSLVALAGLGIVISIVFKLHDPDHKFHYEVILKIYGLVFILALIFGVIASM